MNSWGGPLFRAMRRDRFLLLMTLALSVLALVPLSLAYYLPLTDLHYHLALSSLAKMIWAGDPVVSHHFMLQPRPSPYWTSYLLLMGIGSVTGPVLAGHIVVGVAVLLLPLGFMRLLLAVGRSPRLGLWAFALAWDFSLSMGFLSYCLGVGLSLIFVARALESLRGGKWTSRAELTKTAALALLLPWTHAQAAAAAGVLLTSLSLFEWVWGPRQQRKTRVLKLMGWAVLPGLGLLPWVLSAPSKSHQEGFSLMSVYWAPAGERLVRFVWHSVGFIQGKGASEIQGMTILVLLLGPLLLLLLGRGSPRAFRRAFALYSAAWALFLLLPASLFWPFHQIFIYERYATFVLLLGLLLPGARLIKERQHLLWPGLLAATFSLLLVASFFHRWDQQTRPFRKIVAAIPSGSTVLPIIWSIRTPESSNETLVGMAGYYNAEKGGYTPHIFATPNLPVLPVEDHALPTPIWKFPAQFNVTEHGYLYDYILVQGLESDTLRESRYRTKERGMVSLQIVLEAGLWRLYKVSPDRPAAVGSSSRVPVAPRRSTPGP